MPLAINTKTGIIRDYPTNVIFHRILGRNLELYFDEIEEEEDKVVIERKVIPKRKQSEAVADDIVSNEESNVTSTILGGAE